MPDLASNLPGCEPIIMICTEEIFNTCLICQGTVIKVSTLHFLSLLSLILTFHPPLGSGWDALGQGCGSCAVVTGGGRPMCPGALTPRLDAGLGGWSCLPVSPTPAPDDRQCTGGSHKGVWGARAPQTWEESVQRPRSSGMGWGDCHCVVCGWEGGQTRARLRGGGIRPGGGRGGSKGCPASHLEQ